MESADGNGGDDRKEERIFVSVRVRPLNSEEAEKNDHSKWDIVNNTISINKNSLPDRSNIFPCAYTFDRVFGQNINTRQVYEEGAKEVALSVVNGINSSIFAYGQTSSGKTYTMNGITEYTVEDIYDYILKHKEREFILKFSAIEIYNEAVRDLLSSDSNPLRLLDDPERGTVVEKLIEKILRDKSHFEELLAICEDQRLVGETSLNEASSRSHQILRLTVESSARHFHAGDNPSSIAATVNFVDLAGSEKASQATGTVLKEGSHINRSLLTLGTVIRKLSKGRNGHVPYRDSKLTRILQNSLGGNARTALICTMSPASVHAEQSRNTLLFASCAKEVATSAKVNFVMTDKALVKHLQREVSRLEDELRSHEDELKERDAQITKMEKIIMQLIQQSGFAQSIQEVLLSSVGDDRASRQSVESIVQSIVSEYESSISKASGTHHQNSNSAILSRNSGNSRKAAYISLKNHRDSNIARSLSECSENQCKEVQCIAINDSKNNGMKRNLLLDEALNSHQPMSLEAKLMKNNGEKDFPGRPEDDWNENFSTSFGTKFEVSQKLEGSFGEEFVVQGNKKVVAISSFVEEPHRQHQKLEYKQEMYHTPKEVHNVEESKRDANTETLLNFSESPSQWSLEFERQQKEIIELWDACNVSLIHRTYFFLLFKGEPTDSIYMKVEHRRLSFLKRMISQEPAILSSSQKKLRQERSMLHRRMRKRLSSEERKHFYIKWGIKLNSKQRAKQLTQLLWAETKNIEQTKQSALLAAKLIGLHPEQAREEMFGLSFILQESHQSSFSRIRMPSFRRTDGFEKYQE